MLITQTQTHYARPYSQDDEPKNPFRDRLEGFEYLEVHDRLERYTDTYDNSEYDTNPARGITDVFDNSGDDSVGRNMRFHGDRAAGVYSETRFNSNAAGDTFGFTRLSFSNQDGKVTVQQAADRDGDKVEEFFRETVVDRASGQILSVIER